MPFLSGAPPIFTLVFLVAVGIILFQVVKSVAQTVNNMGQPVIERQARLVAKRTQVRMSGGGPNMAARSRTSYYITFEFPDGGREELSVRGEEYGLLVEGDMGLLRSQGTWFKGFARQHGE